MKASEFRLSNLITFEGITVKFEELIQDSISSDTELDERIQPILLTKEWLLKFGFELIECYNFKKGSFIVYSGHREFHFWSIKGIDVPPIYFIHQLQNLYFALTGKELCVE